VTSAREVTTNPDGRMGGLLKYGTSSAIHSLQSEF